MTYLEVHSAAGVKRWKIGDLPEGDGEQGYLKRLEWLQTAIAHYERNMAYAFKDAVVYIIHEAKFESYETELR